MSICKCNGFIFDSNDDDALLFKKEEIDCCCRENKSESYKKKKIDVIYKIFRSIYLNTSLLILIQKNLFNYIMNIRMPIVHYHQQPFLGNN